jgi:hypothetical protein
MNNLVDTLPDGVFFLNQVTTKTVSCKNEALYKNEVFAGNVGASTLFNLLYSNKKIDTMFEVDLNGS